jgi:outer membrane protein OmpA-like peptidoglycan-associated protein
VGAEEGIELGYNRFAFKAFGSNSWSTASAGNTALYAAGVVHLTPRESKYRPFLLIGPEYVFYKAPNFGKIGTPPSPVVLLPPGGDKQQGRTAITYGVGLKINQSPRWGVRFDLRGTRSGSPHFGIPAVPYGTGSIYLPSGDYHESSLTASVGVVFRFRYREPVVPAGPYIVPHAEMKAAATVQVGAISGGKNVCAGDDVSLTVSASSSDNSPLSYQWMVNGSPAPGGNSATFRPATDSPGQKTITVKVSAGSASGTSAPVTVGVQALTPPTITFAISPSTVMYGAKVPLAANAAGSSCAALRGITYSGQGVTGTTFDSSALSFDMSNRLKEQSQTVTIRATATDAKNQTASASANVTVKLIAQARRLDDIVFPQGSARVNNCAKRLLLEELTPMLKADPDAKVILIGHRDVSEKGKAMSKLDEARVVNAAAVLSAGKGICPSLDLGRVMVNSVGTDQNDETRPALCGTSTNVKEKGGQGVKESDKRAPFRRVEIWIIPGGADTPGNLSGLKPAPMKEIQAKGCPK